ncbi:MAG: substrate-binding domain-containing protein [Verrucomicrobia bacterium]|nr:substrate-binding domain-containing protein [Verrucomicrobiota bacterium]
MKERKFRSVGIFKSVGCLLGLLSLHAAGTAAGQPTAEGGLPAYAKSGALSGTLKAAGSESMEEVFELWQAEFARLNAGTVIQREFAGSSSAPPLLVGGQVQLAAMSRPMTDAEVDSFAKAKGYKPTQVPVALDAVVVVVKKENPIRGLTLKDLDGIYTSTRRSGSPPVKTWGDLGLTESWATTAVAPVGRDATSGTHAMFRQAALANGDFHDGVSISAGPRSAIRAVAAAEGGIGYAGFAALTNKVRPLPLGRTADALVAPSAATCADGSYPLARTLYLYVDRKPGQPLDPLTAEFLRFVLAREGQALVNRAGLIPLPLPTVQAARTQLF